MYYQKKEETQLVMEGENLENLENLKQDRKKRDTIHYSSDSTC